MEPQNEISAETSHNDAERPRKDNSHCREDRLKSKLIDPQVKVLLKAMQRLDGDPDLDPTFLPWPSPEGGLAFVHGFNETFVGDCWSLCVVFKGFD